MIRGELLDQERRRRWSPEQKLAMVRESLQSGQSVSVVARQNGVNANQLFQWRKLYQSGSLSAVGAGESVVPASELADALKQIRELNRPGFRRHLFALNWTAPSIVDISSLCFEHRRKSMSTQRFTPEFKAEAVRQVIERGYSVAETAERLGVSTHSLYKWVKSVTPDKTEKQASELLEAKSEILRLRAQMRRLEEERDILKKAARYFAREPE